MTLSSYLSYLRNHPVGGGGGGTSLSTRTSIPLFPGLGLGFSFSLTIASLALLSTYSLLQQSLRTANPRRRCRTSSAQSKTSSEEKEEEENNSKAAEKEPPPLIPLALAALEAYTTLSPDAIGAQLSDRTFIHAVLPASLRMPTRRSKSAYLAHARTVLGVFERFQFSVANDDDDGGGGGEGTPAIWEDRARSTVVMRVRMRGLLRFGLGEWENEGLVVCEFGWEEEKERWMVVGWREFVDSARARLLKEMLEGAMGKGRERGGGVIDVDGEADGKEPVVAGQV